MKKWQLGLLTGLGSAVVAGGIVGGSMAIANSVKQKRAHEADMAEARSRATRFIISGYTGAIRRLPESKERAREITNYALNSLNKVNNVCALYSIGRIAAAGCDATSETGTAGDYFVSKTKEYIDYSVKYDYSNKVAEEENDEYTFGFRTACVGLIGAQKRALVNNLPTVCEQLYQDFKTICVPNIVKTTEVNSGPIATLFSTFFAKSGEDYTRRESYLELLNYYLGKTNKNSLIKNTAISDLANSILIMFREKTMTIFQAKELSAFWFMKMEGQTDATVKALGKVACSYYGMKPYAQDVNEFNRVVFEFAVPYCFKFNSLTVSIGIEIISTTMNDVLRHPQYTDAYIERAKNTLSLILK